jgi:hypothetical protein
LLMGCSRESARTHIGDPNLDRAQTLPPQALPMRSNIFPRGLGSSRCRHSGPPSGYLEAYHLPSDFARKARFRVSRSRAPLQSRDAWLT